MINKIIFSTRGKDMPLRTIDKLQVDIVICFLTWGLFKDNCLLIYTFVTRSVSPMNSKVVQHKNICLPLLESKCQLVNTYHDLIICQVKLRHN